MKIILACLLPLLYCCLSFAQTGGKIVSKLPFPQAGITNTYIYTPPKGLLIPERLQALIAYESHNKFFKQAVPASKENGRYCFSFKAPHSTAILIVSMVNGKEQVLSTNSLTIPQKQVIDNNVETGFVINLHNQQKQRFVYENVQLARLLSGYARYALQLKPLPDDILIKMYEDAYSLHPSLKEDETYIDYLMMLYKNQPVDFKPALIRYASDMLSKEHSEVKWLNAAKIYQSLNMPDELEKTTAKILTAFPNGIEAGQIFWNEFYQAKDKTEQSILASMASYINRFGDSSYSVKARFYNPIISFLIDRKDWCSLYRYETLVSKKLLIPYNYNSAAWRIVDKIIHNPGGDLAYAKLLSQKSLKMIGEIIKDSSNSELYDEDLYRVQDMFMNTYALIQYKLGEFDSAFYLQHAIFIRGKDLLDVNGMERYAMYAEQVKGSEYAKTFLEQALLSGVSSELMQTQLQRIYNKLNLPDETFEKVVLKNNLLEARNNEKVILKKYGTLKAKDFTLKNLDGGEVTLSSLINKVVVLDFWATWCGPCRASFPAMQVLLNKYKGDSSVVFLFIDVWENTTPLKMKTAASQLLKENNYGFTVLLDVNDKVVNDYRVDGIPTKFVIDKKGNIVSMGDELKDLSVNIDAAKK